MKTTYELSYVTHMRQRHHDDGDPIRVEQSRTEQASNHNFLSTGVWFCEKIGIGR